MKDRYVTYIAAQNRKPVFKWPNDQQAQQKEKDEKTWLIILNSVLRNRYSEGVFIGAKIRSYKKNFKKD